jgi:hypothetical protein
MGYPENSFAPVRLLFGPAGIPMAVFFPQYGTRKTQKGHPEAMQFPAWLFRVPQNHILSGMPLVLISLWDTTRKTHPGYQSGVSLKKVPFSKKLKKSIDFYNQ